MIVPEPVIPVVEVIVSPNSVDAAENIFSPLAASTLSAKLATIKTFSPELEVCGTIGYTNLRKPLTLLQV